MENLFPLQKMKQNQKNFCTLKGKMKFCVIGTIFPVQNNTCNCCFPSLNLKKKEK